MQKQLNSFLSIYILSCNESKEEHHARVASVSLGLVLLVLIPSLLLLVCAAHYWIREKIAEEEAAGALLATQKRKIK
ncbi:hypothetical protein CVS40_0271 [Lucilia cuprina]|nr:hypothetical protein CVS40_0271 [Lucilia cuprina]